MIMHYSVNIISYSYSNPAEYCITWTVGYYIPVTCKWVCMGLDGSTCSESLPVGTCHFEPPDHVPRTSARIRTCAVVSGRAPCVPRSREHEKRPATGREKNAEVPKKTRLYVYIYVSCRLSHASRVCVILYYLNFGGRTWGYIVMTRWRIPGSKW